MEDSKSCEFCDEKFETVKDCKKHMKSHSYQVAKFKCVDCEFVGTNEYSMEVHNGKCHTDNFECGMCEFVAGNEEKLELHLFTCEIYHCFVCNIKGTNISEMKRHIESEHDGNQKLRHVKLSTNNANEVTFKSYFIEEI